MRLSKYFISRLNYASLCYRTHVVCWMDWQELFIKHPSETQLKYLACINLQNQQLQTNRRLCSQGLSSQCQWLDGHQIKRAANGSLDCTGKGQEGDVACVTQPQNSSSGCWLAGSPLCASACQVFRWERSFLGLRGPRGRKYLCCRRTR